MSQTSIARHDIRPYFDMEAFMQMSRETRLGGATLERLVALWGDWLPVLNVCEISTGKISWLAVWLPQEVEDTVDETWGKSASDGFLVNNLAQFMCMSVVQEMLPQVEEGGCAPSPRPVQALRDALAELGVPYRSDESSLLSRRYAVVTHYPYKGGCEICHMQSHCPKGQGQGENAGVLLPGYERGAEGEDA
ncbi:MAG: hypothetical protein Q4F27_06990 [Desulfovibrionaceae bacterium]|nr:hypothetical protein [Desulfovibrionaceae bacterium]